MAVIFLKQFQNLVEEDRSKRRRAVVEALHVLRPRVNIILKSGTEWQIMLDMDDHTFARHFRVSKTRFEVLKGYLQEGGLQSDHSHGLPPPPPAYCQEEWQERMGEYRLLGDSAYIGQDFPFIISPRRDNGALTDADLRRNTDISRGRVIIEQAFGRMKCKWRRIRDLQNTCTVTIAKIILAACYLHNFSQGASIGCDEHPDGCPREDDANQ
ncbi:unnamed protein product [Boreogadus saida]